MKENENILLVVIFMIIFYNLFVCRGINGNCKICYNKGHHYHLGELSVHKNHGPMKTKHTMCQTCMKNKGMSHFHLC